MSPPSLFSSLGVDAAEPNVANEEAAPPEKAPNPFEPEVDGFGLAAAPELANPLVEANAPNGEAAVAEKPGGRVVLGG